MMPVYDEGVGDWTGAWSAIEIARRVNTGIIDAAAATLRAHAAINAANRRLNAIVDFDPSICEPQLDLLRARLARGERPPLAGVPVAIKDHIHVKGWRATEGSLLFKDFVATDDDPVITRLRAAGAILVGRTNMSEFGCKGVTTNLLYGPTRHPADNRLTTGGSSGGAAAAIAGRMVPLALASDGGGSIRRPAAHAGVVGYKPSSGVVADPRAFSHTAVLGVMANCVADAGAMLDALSGYDARDPVSFEQREAEPDLDKLNFAWSPKLGLDVPVDDDVAAALQVTIQKLHAVGFRIDRRDPVWPPGAGEDAVMPIQHAELALAFGERYALEPQMFDPDIGVQIESGMRLKGVDVCRAQAMSIGIARAAAAFFAAGNDLLLTPTVPCVAWPHTRLGPETIGGRSVAHRAHAVFTPLFNHAFCPAISIPAGFARDSLPVGLQIVGPRFADQRVLAAAAAIELALGRAEPIRSIVADTQ